MFKLDHIIEWSKNFTFERILFDIFVVCVIGIAVLSFRSMYNNDDKTKTEILTTQKLLRTSLVEILNTHSELTTLLKKAEAREKELIDQNETLIYMLSRRQSDRESLNLPMPLNLIKRLDNKK